MLDLSFWGYYENSTEITIEPLKELLFGNVNNQTTLPKLRRVDRGPHFVVPLEAKINGGSMRQTFHANSIMGNDYFSNSFLSY